MKKTNVVFLFGVFLVVISSCKKEEEPIPPTEEPTNTFYIQNTPGSYWIYLTYEIDSTGAETQLAYRDSVYMAGDSVLNGKTYAHYSGTWLGIQKDVFIRDSSGFIVNQYGSIQYNHINYTDTVSASDNGQQITYSMTAAGRTNITVPAISTNCFDHQIHYYQSNGAPMTACDSVWIQHAYYNFNGGEEVITQYALLSPLQSQCKYLERRLVIMHHEP